MRCRKQEDTPITIACGYGDRRTLAIAVSGRGFIEA
jgi:hypothetical protein